MRVVAAAALSFMVAEALSLPQSLWAVITALMIVQLSLGGTIAAGVDRLLGTLAGAVVGVAASLVGKLSGAHPALLLVVTVAPLAFLAALRPSFRIAPLTAAIVLLATPSSASPVTSAIYRVVEIALGTVIGIIVSILVLPSRARHICLERSAEMLKLLAQALMLHLQMPDPMRRVAIDRINDRTLAELGRIATAAREVRREFPLLGNSEPAQDRLVRTMRRLRSDIAFVGRATSTGDLDWRGLGPPLSEVGDAFRAALEALSEALLSSNHVPDLGELDAAIMKLQLALDREPQVPPAAAVLPFIFQTLRRDLGDLIELLAPPKPASVGIDEGTAA
ncbi:FUSC family protein [Mesorhizobium sp. BAC0120]|uniref:FUSC family protein n=1 Tax=Mesorhizobium sp. BAC0120 TaxID=3090670 RepID=UPI00298BEFDE|nr:FUSC family protein [Mesorhizobium sp. BAC0120]MDW6021373.1 FUSC family protein [Mesorhizobium sp. BAC0120]